MCRLDLILMVSIAALLVGMAAMPASAMEKGAAIALGFGSFGLALVSASIIGLAFKLADRVVRACAARQQRQMNHPATAPGGAAYS